MKSALAGPTADTRWTAYAHGAAGELGGLVVTIDPGHNGDNGAHPDQINQSDEIAWKAPFGRVAERIFVRRQIAEQMADLKRRLE